MTAHVHLSYVDGCYRCELNKDEDARRLSGKRDDRWSAGAVDSCSGGFEHRPVALHVIVRCICGAAYMSTDGSIALAMARDHETAQPLTGGVAQS